jgi:hypothetical protein
MNEHRDILIKVIGDIIKNNPDLSKEEVQEEIEKVNPNMKNEQYFCDYYEDLYRIALVEYKLNQNRNNSNDNSNNDNNSDDNSSKTAYEIEEVW